MTIVGLVIWFGFRPVLEYFNGPSPETFVEAFWENPDAATAKYSVSSDESDRDHCQFAHRDWSVLGRGRGLVPTAQFSEQWHEPKSSRVESFTIGPIPSDWVMPSVPKFERQTSRPATNSEFAPVPILVLMSRLSRRPLLLPALNYGNFSSFISIPIRR